MSKVTVGLHDKLILWLQSRTQQQPTIDVFKSIHLINKYVLSFCYVPGTVLDAEDTEVTKTDKGPCPQVACSCLH